MKKLLKYLFPLLALAAVYPVFTAYVKQEELIFGYYPLPQEHRFEWDHPHKEVYYSPDEASRIHGALFHVENPQGIVFYLHGQFMNLNRDWDTVAKIFTSRGYDFLIIDYRKSGKSHGKITEETILGDCLHIYDDLKEKYKDKKIFVVGQSLGTGFATYVAANRSPNALILQAPYLSMLNQAYLARPYFPKFIFPLILRFPIRTDVWISEVTCPIYIFHGTNDDLCPYESSLQLMEKVRNKETSHLITLQDWGHSYLFRHHAYPETIDRILKEKDGSPK